jgi:hypothetical protein
VKPETEKALAAMQRAADEAWKLAAMHGVKIPVWRDGRVVYVDPKEGIPAESGEKPAA